MSSLWPMANEPKPASFAEIKAAGGGSTVLARKLGLHFTVLSEWTKRGRIPAEQVLAVSRETGIHPSKIRPDIYPPSRFPPPDKVGET